MYQMLQIVEDWRKKYKNDATRIVFQNERLKSNIILNQNSLNNISRKSKGFENIPDAVMAPDEVWSSIDSGKVIRQYIKEENSLIFVVTTINGLIEEIDLTTSKKYKKGVWLI